VSGAATGQGAATAVPVKTVLMTPSTQTQGVRVDVDVIYLDDIPKAMDNMGWKVSAQMMRRWFATKPAWAMPEPWRVGKNINYLALPASQVEDQIIKMKWVLGFDRVVPVFEDLCQNWNNEAGIVALRTRLATAGWQPGKTFNLGRGFKRAKELDLSCQVNWRKFGDYTDTLDDLYGAIFKATFKLAVIGKASRSIFSKRDLFEVEKIAVYVRDTYDFNVDLFEDAAFGLGIWGKRRMLSKKEMMTYKVTHLAALANVFPGFVPARNGDFRRWQNDRNEGGDFFVFSDVMWMPPNIEYVYF
jgi:hypothetical protein